MKNIFMAIIALAFAASVSFAQPQSGQGSGNATQLKTKIQDRKQLRKRDSTGVYHEQNMKTRATRRKDSVCVPKGNGMGTGAMRRGQGPNGPK